MVRVEKFKKKQHWKEKQQSLPLVLPMRNKWVQRASLKWTFENKGMNQISILRMSRGAQTGWILRVDQDLDSVAIHLEWKLLFVQF